MYIFVSNAQTEAYERVYVDGKQAATDANVTMENASSNVGAYVRVQVYEEYKVSKNKKVGLASIVATEDGKITISTTDFTEIGQIDALGGILNWNSATASEVNALIGTTVTDYNVTTDGITGWRVFYASDSEMFLISTNAIESGTVFGSSNGIPLGNYSTGADVFSPKSGTGYSDVEYGKTYNKNWYDAGGSSDNETRSKATAYLCDPANWTKYVKTGAPAGTYAVGGPTKELLVLSWNAAKDNNVTGAPTTTVTWETSDVVAAGYLYNKPSALRENNPIKSDIESGLYNTGDAHYWLASPSSNSSNDMCLVNYSNSNVGFTDYYQSIIGIRPIVSIPMTHVKVNDTTITIQ